MRFTAVALSLLALCCCAAALEISNGFVSAGGFAYSDTVGGVGGVSVGTASQPNPVFQGESGFAIGVGGAWVVPSSEGLTGLTTFPPTSPTSIVNDRKYTFSHTYDRSGAGLSNVEITGTCTTILGGAEMYCDYTFDSGADAFGNLEFVHWADGDAAGDSNDDFAIVSAVDGGFILKIAEINGNSGLSISADFDSLVNFSTLGYAVTRFSDFPENFRTTSSSSNIDSALLPGQAVVGFNDIGFGPGDVVVGLGFRFDSSATTASISLETSGIWDYAAGGCGNGDVSNGEVCDGVNRNGETCATLVGEGFIGDPNCFLSCLDFDTTGCFVAPTPTATATSTPAPSAPAPTPTPGASSAPVPSASPAPTTFNNNAQTANVIIDLDVAVQPRSVLTNPLSTEIETVIASFMNININSVDVVKVTTNEEASVLICAGNVSNFINALNTGNPFFDDTVLEGALIENAFFGITCENPLDNLPSNSYWGADDDDLSSFVSTQVTTFDVFSNDGNSPGGGRVGSSSSGAAALVPSLAALFLFAVYQL